MRRRTRCVAVSLLLAAAPLTACGGGDEPEPTDAVQAPGTTPTTEAAVPDVNPQAALLTLDDMPAGYVVDSSPESTEDTTPSPVCPELEATDVSAADDGRTAQVGFVGGELGPIVFHAVGDQDPGTAAEEFEKMRAALAKPECRTFQDTGLQGRAATWTLSRINTVRVGDDTLGLRISADEAGLFTEFDLAVERVGDNVSVVGVTRVPMVGPIPPDLNALLRRAHQKLVGATPTGA